MAKRDLYYRAPRNLTATTIGYHFIGTINLQTFFLQRYNITIDFQDNEYFEATLCATFGALIDWLKSRRHKVQVINISPESMEVFENTGFYGLVDKEFTKEVAYGYLSYKKFSLLEAKAFQEYVENQLLSHESFPRISDLLKKKITESLLELFNNAHIHGECGFVHTCGEYNPRTGVLKFSISDLGKTIRKKVNEHFGTGRSLSGATCIEWAVVKGTTTKKNVPGGLGFNLIREFLAKNEGTLHIMSSTGFWEEEKGKPRSQNCEFRILGTIVNLEFNLKDKKSYILESELQASDVL